MENESRIGRMLEKAREWVAEQEWFQQLKAKWEELDPQSRLYAKAGAGGVAALAFLFAIVSSIWSVQSLKSELRTKQELVDQLQASSDELSRLKGESPDLGAEGEKPNWPVYFSENAVRAGVEGGAVTVSDEKAGPKVGDTQESLFDIQLKKVSIKNVVRLALGLEGGSKPVKLRALAINTNSDPEGYMDATLSVSAYSTVASGK
ncbi:MAG TPA: hypothetical protein VM598_07575 [Bdellovibrionota bacterium]|nr:hypothetical protein [Bdellovibrionota bacterium]